MVRFDRWLSNRVVGQITTVHLTPITDINHYRPILIRSTRFRVTFRLVIFQWSDFCLPAGSHLLSSKLGLLYCNNTNIDPVLGHVLRGGDRIPRHPSTGKTCRQLFSVGFRNLCPTYGVKLLPTNETSRILGSQEQRALNVR